MPEMHLMQVRFGCGQRVAECREVLRAVEQERGGRYPLCTRLKKFFGSSCTVSSIALSLIFSASRTATRPFEASAVDFDAVLGIRNDLLAQRLYFVLELADLGNDFALPLAAKLGDDDPYGLGEHLVTLVAEEGTRRGLRSARRCVAAVVALDDPGDGVSLTDAADDDVCSRAVLRQRGKKRLNIPEHGRSAAARA